MESKYPPLVSYDEAKVGGVHTGVISTILPKGYSLYI